MTTLQVNPFIERLVRCLVPYFIGVTTDLQAAQAEALETLVSYGARTRAELMNAVQVIILGFSTLDTLGEANDPGMSPSQRLRFRGCANNLHRNGQKAEQTLIKRLARDVPVPTPPEVELINDLPDQGVEATLQQTQSDIAAARSRLPAARPSQDPQPQPISRADRDKQLWGSAMMQTLADMEMPVQPSPNPPSQL